MLSFGATCVAENALPEDSHTSSAGVSDGCAHAPVHLVMHCHQDQERSCLRASFNAAMLWGGNGLQWWLIYTIFFPLLSFLLSVTRVLFSALFCSFLCLRTFVPRSRTLHNSRYIFSSPKCCFWVDCICCAPLWKDEACVQCILSIGNRVNRVGTCLLIHHQGLRKAAVGL